MHFANCQHFDKTLPARTGTHACTCLFTVFHSVFRQIGILGIVLRRLDETLASSKGSIHGLAALPIASRITPAWRCLPPLTSSGFEYRNLVTNVEIDKDPVRLRINRQRVNSFFRHQVIDYRIGIEIHDFNVA